MGDLYSVDANNGTLKWRLKLGIDERNACPLFADGKLYVPMLDDPASKATGEAEGGTTGAFYIIRPGEKEGEILCHVALDGRCFGTPVAFNGKLYLQTTRHLYCWGTKGDNPGCSTPPEVQPWPAAGPATQLQVIPSEVLLHPGEKATFRVRSLDANGLTVQDSIPAKQVTWASYIPPTAKVKAAMKGAFNADGVLQAAPDAVPSAGAFEATMGALKGYIRGRVLPNVPSKEDFESFNLTETNAARRGVCLSAPAVDRRPVQVRRAGEGREQGPGEDHRQPVLPARDGLHRHARDEPLHHPGGRDERRQQAQDVGGRRHQPALPDCAEGQRAKARGELEPGAAAGVGGFQVVAERVVSAQSACGAEPGRLGRGPGQSVEARGA